jgi:hypothetical protein
VAREQVYLQDPEAPLKVEPRVGEVAISLAPPTSTAWHSVQTPVRDCLSTQAQASRPTPARSTKHNPGGLSSPRKNETSSVFSLWSTRESEKTTEVHQQTPASRAFSGADPAGKDSAQKDAFGHSAEKASTRKTHRLTTASCMHPGTSVFYSMAVQQWM